MSERVCIVYHDMITVYGHGVSRCMEALFANRTDFREITRFGVRTEPPARAACFPAELIPDDLENPAENSILRLLDRMEESGPFLRECAAAFWALTQGEIDKLDNAEKVWTAKLLERAVAKRLPTGIDSRIFSASCASGNIALARAAFEISSGRAEQVVVLGCDVVSEFTFSGFSSVHALTPTTCRPYDSAHDGLLLGDAAGVMVLCSEKKAKRNRWPVLAVIEGYGITTDAYHAAAPDPEGRQMARAIRQVLDRLPGKTVAGVIGHGTGTVLNDDMEIAALNEVFPAGLPLASIKGGTGHILAASGLIQGSCAIDCLDRGQMFPQTSLRTPRRGAEKFVSDRPQSLRGDLILTLNAGFGGLNAVIGIGRY